MFSTDTDKLIESNVGEIKKWLLDIKNDLEISATDSVIILSPCHHSNMRFINLANDLLFGSAATIIHQQVGDYLLNFKHLNKHNLARSGVKIYFVDDSLISGVSFFNLYDMYRFATDYGENNLRGAIFLSDKSSPDVHKRVKKAAKEKVYAFVNVNLPMAPRVFDKRPIEHEIKRYNDLSEIALHDVVKKIFRSKAEDLKGKKENAKLPPYTDERRLQHLNMFKATHKAYEIFSSVSLGSVEKLRELKPETFLKETGFDTSIEKKIAMMKVLSQYPFLLYMYNREWVYRWHKQWFFEKCEDIKTKIEENKQITYSDFKELKFLIRRATFLGNLYILSKKFLVLLEALFKLIEDNGVVNISQEKLFDEDIVALKDNEICNVEDFHIFLLQQLAEIIQKNGWCAAKFLQNIDEDYHGETPKEQQFLRMLRLEASVVLNDFYLMLDEDPDWNENYTLPQKEDLFEGVKGQNEKIIKYFQDKNEVYTSNKFEISNSVLGLKLDDGTLKPAFITYLCLKQFLREDYKSRPIRDGEKERMDLSDKTAHIFDKFKRLFDYHKEIGAFFIVEDGNDKSHLVYDTDQDGGKFIKELDDSNHMLIINFLKGQPDEQNIGNKTIIQFHKEDGKYVDSYALLEEDRKGEEFSSESHWFLLMRISDINFKTLGLIGFYGDKNNQPSLLTKQLLMLVRKDIGNFIEKHHKNDEFAALREAEVAKRFAYLAGHGRQMMQRLSKEEPTIFLDVIGTMEKLQYLFAIKWISPTGNSEGKNREIKDELFTNIFLGKFFDQRKIDNIGKMGTKVYHSEYVDNSEKEIDCEVIGKDQFNSSFPFNSDIVEFICFELFVNAKKNRYHFIKDWPECSCGNNKNTIKIQFESSETNQMIITVSGTGPRVSSNISHLINSGEVKKDFEISGLRLINKIIKMSNTRNMMKIIDEELCPSCGIHENSMKITLEPVHNG